MQPQTIIRGHWRTGRVAHQTRCPLQGDRIHHCRTATLPGPRAAPMELRDSDGGQTHLGCVHLSGELLLKCQVIYFSQLLVYVPFQRPQ